MINMIRGCAAILFGLPGYRYHSLLCALGGAAICAIFSHGIVTLLIAHGCWVEVARITGVSLVGLVAFILICSRPHILESICTAAGCLLVAHASLVLDSETPDRNGLVLHWLIPFLPGVWIIYRALASGFVNMFLEPARRRTTDANAKDVDGPAHCGG